MKLVTLLQKALFGPVGPNFYKENQHELCTTNYALLRRACLFSTGMCLFLFCLTLVNSLISELSLFYLLYTLFFAMLTALVLTVANRKRMLIPYLFYIFSGAIFMLAIDVGTRYSPQLPAITFYVFLIIIPILFVTRPIYAVLLSLAACSAFCVVTTHVKGAGSFLAQTDILNAICCCIVGIGVDITIVNLQLENIQGKSYFKLQSTTDELTGLPNRRSFDVYIETFFCQKASIKNQVFILMMDVDNFKAYNDTYGHIQGDECLCQVSRALERTAQAHGVFLARFGGEEFVAVAQPHKNDEMRKIATRFVECVAELKIRHEASPEGSLTVSVGYAGTEDMDMDDYRKVLDCADMALYTAKEKGKNRACAWNATAD